ncbi:MAG: cytochrome ubiquinol oxidase subunit I [Polyangiales bacterium]
MDPLLAARWQMEVSLGFHMVFAALGIGMPLLMVIAEVMYLRGAGEHWKSLAKTWGKATALLFVVGAVSGTALSFELGLLWPKFMSLAGPVVGPAFALEGYAFLIEAIFVGLYLYGWERLSKRAHLFAGVVVAFSGLMSGVLVVGANAWMQSPRGFAMTAGRVTDVDMFATFRNPSWLPLAVHSSFSCYISVGFAVAGVYAIGLLRGNDGARARAGITLGMAVGAIASLCQIVSGDRVAKLVGRTQPEKLAAMEAHFHTEAGAPILVGGLPDPATETVRFGLHIPKGLSFLATGDPNATIRGLAEFPVDQRPNTILCHLAFQVMVGGGSALLGLSAFYWLWRWRKGDAPRWMLWLVGLASPLGFLALEAGWIVTEAGRQPWIVYHVLRTRDAVTPRTDVGVTLVLYVVIYIALSVALVGLLRKLAHKEEAS